jgi:integrase
MTRTELAAGRIGPCRITKQVIEQSRARAAADGQPCLVWDNQLRGYGISVGKTGAVSYICQWWSGGRTGKSRRVVVGHHGQPVPAGTILDGKPLPDGRIVTEELGRKLAAAMIARIKSGFDPHAQRAILKQQAKVQAETFRTVLDGYLDNEGTNRRSWDQTRRTLEYEFREGGAAADLADKPLVELSRQDFRRVRDAIKLRGNSACRAYFAQVNPFLKWCVEENKLDESPAEKIAVPAKPDQRDRVLIDQELRAVWQATDNLTDYRHRDIVRLLILTGQRHTEVELMRWSELDLVAATWTIPASRSKNKLAHQLDLSPQALTILTTLRQLYRYAGHDPVFVAPGRQGVALTIAKKEIDALLPGILGREVEPWTLHDLRRSFATGLRKLRIQPNIIEKCINHRSGENGGMRGVYQHFDDREERRDAHMIWGNHIEQLVTGSNVVALRA